MKVKCPKCNSLQEADSASSDGIFTCPDCGQKMKLKTPVPEKEAEPESAVSESKPVPKPESPKRGASKRRSARSSRRRGARTRGRGEAEDEGALDRISNLKNKKMNEKNAVILVVSFVLLFVVFIIAMTMYGDSKAKGKEQPKVSATPDRGIDALEEMVYNDPTNMDLRIELGELLLGVGEVMRAQQHLSKVVDSRNDIRVYNSYVKCLLKQNKLEEAEMYYKRAVKFAPRQLETLEKLIGDYYYNNGLELPQAKEIEGFEEAMEKLKQAEIIFKENPRDNDKRKEVVKMIDECMIVFQKGKDKYPLNRLIDGRMVKANSILVMARKMMVTEDKPVKPAEKDTPKEVDKSL